MRFPASLPALSSAVLLLLAFGAGCATPSGASDKGTSESASGPAQATDFTLRTVEGRTFRLSDHLQKDIILLNFWATWCTPCLGEMPELEKMHQALKGQGVQIVGVSMDGPESVANVQPTVRRLGVTYPVLLDEETRVVGVYNPRRDAPYTVIIDREGRVAQRFVGYAPGDEAKLEDALRKLLAGEAEAAGEADMTGAATGSGSAQ